MLLLFSLLIFAFFMLLSMGFILRSKSSLLLDVLGRGKQDQVAASLNFFDVLWDTPPPVRLRFIRQGGIIAGAGFIIGLMFAPQASLVFALVAFALAPRVINTLETNKKKSDFFKQFPRAVAEVAAVARTQTMLDGFKVVATEHKAPVSEVFGYIAEVVDKGGKLHEALKDAYKQYQYPGLDKLSDAVRVIDELGGGERAAEVLVSAADHIRFLERFRSKVDSNVGGIIKEIGIATAIVVGYFLITSGPHTEGWENARNHPMVVLTGFAAIGVGWYFAMKKINDFKNKIYM